MKLYASIVVRTGWGLDEEKVYNLKNTSLKKIAAKLSAVTTKETILTIVNIWNEEKRNEMIEESSKD